MIRPVRRYFHLVALGSLLGVSCSTPAPPQELPIVSYTPTVHETAPPQRPASPADRGIVDEIRSLTEQGTLSSLLEARDLIRTRELEGSEFGRVMNAVIARLIQIVYPDRAVPVPVRNQSQTHSYSRILQNVAEGIYVSPRPNTQDYLEQVLPCLALFSETSKNRPERLLDALPDLRRAEELNPQAVLAPYFMGLIYERSNRPTRAIAAYKRVYELFDECYPAVLGQARVLAGIGQESEAIDALKQLLSRFPDNILIKQHLARIYYAARDWSRAEQAIAEILQRDTQDPEFMLMQAHTLVEQGQFFKALVPLDRYAAFKPNDRLYLLLRAKVQAEGYHNRDAALTYLRGILKMFPMDEEASVYTAALLLESSRREHQIEGRELLRSLLAVEHSSLELVDLAFRDAVQREAWEDAQGYVDRLLQERRTQYLLSAAQVAQGLGNAAAAFSYAQEFHEQDPTSEEGTIAYIAALIDRGQRDEAQRLIESHLAGAEGVVKAQYYYLRSRIRGTEAEVLEDLRSSLFEDPRNLNALMAMVELYHRRKDQRRVVYYLKQALTFAPDNARLQQYEQEYLL